MTEEEKTLKTSLIKYILDSWEHKTNYRWDDIIDYICEHWKLDEEWESYFEKSTQALFNMSFNDVMDEWFKSEKRREDPCEYPIVKIAEYIVDELEKRLNEDLEKKL